MLERVFYSEISETLSLPSVSKFRYPSRLFLKRIRLRWKGMTGLCQFFLMREFEWSFFNLYDMAEATVRNTCNYKNYDRRIVLRNFHFEGDPTKQPSSMNSRLGTHAMNLKKEAHFWMAIRPKICSGNLFNIANRSQPHEPTSYRVGDLILEGEFWSMWNKKSIWWHCGSSESNRPYGPKSYGCGWT